jgi:RNA polymerase sigma-70 factor (ECF subfamily)
LIPLDTQPSDGPAPPSPVDVEAENVVQEIVSRGDLGENPLYVRAFLSATGSGGTGSRPVYVGGQHPPKVARQRCAGQAIFPALPTMTARSYTDVSDQQVVVFAQEGREDAYRELIKRYERPVFSLIYRMVRDNETAEDLAQETFIKVLNNIDRYRPEFKFSSWLFKIANNITIDHLRRRQIDTISIEGSPDAVTAERARATSVTVTSGGESPLEELESKELGAAIEKAIARLRPEYRACIILRHVEDYSYDEIAEIVKLPLGTVKTYIHRARQELREYLGDLK